MMIVAINFMCRLYLRFVALTSSIIIDGIDNKTTLAFNKKNFILAVWHNKLFFSAYLERDNNLFTLISHSQDGEYITKVLKKFGFQIIRGSSSKGAVKALVQMIKVIRQGNNAAITPDGPRGPIYNVQPGIVMLAQKTRCPIIPISYASRFKKRLSSWDGFEIPYPFNKIVVTYGKPLYINKDQDMESAVLSVKQALDMNREQGENILTSKE